MNKIKIKTKIKKKKRKSAWEKEIEKELALMHRLISTPFSYNRYISVSKRRG